MSKSKRTEIIDITYLLKQKRIKEDLESYLHKMGIFNLYDVVVEAEQENNIVKFFPYIEHREDKTKQYILVNDDGSLVPVSYTHLTLPTKA